MVWLKPLSRESEMQPQTRTFQTLEISPEINMKGIMACGIHLRYLWKPNQIITGVDGSTQYSITLNLSINWTSYRRDNWTSTKDSARLSLIIGLCSFLTLFFSILCCFTLTPTSSGEIPITPAATAETSYSPRLSGGQFDALNLSLHLVAATSTHSHLWWIKEDGTR